MCEKAKYYERVERRWRPESHRLRAIRTEEENQELRKQAERNRERIAELERQLEERRARLRRRRRIPQGSP